MICDECETVAHCLKNGCVPKQQALDRMAENARELGLDYEPADGTQVSKVWWDGEKLMAKPIPFVEFYKPAPVQEPVAWKNAALELGIELSSVGPNGYYDMTPERWLDWAMAQQPRGKNSLPAAQRQWVGLTDEEIEQEFGFIDELLRDCVHRTEAKLREKNT
jgi:hypothetical protein